MFKRSFIIFITGIVASLLFFTTQATAQSTYFSPKTNLEKVDLQWLKKASQIHKLYVAMYSFTDKPLAYELIALARSGVQVYIYRDDEQMKDRTDVTHLFKGLKNVHIKAKDDKGFWNIMHDKMFVIPGVVYREGSANWSASGEGASCWHGNCGPTENQDNNATYITTRPSISMALKMFWSMWDRKDNIVVQK